MNLVKNLVRWALLTRPGLGLRRRLGSDSTTIVMLHRFAAAEGAGDAPHSAATLRRLLATTRKLHIPVVTLQDVARGAAPGGSIVFTVDDGYRDFARAAWPIFREFDCPVTVFLTTGFLDGALWMWWDRVHWAVERTRVVAARVSVGNEDLRGGLADAASRRKFADDVIESMKRVPDAEREAALAVLPRALEVAIPTACPDEYAPMTWDDVRAAGRQGATFGPHTVTHPILSRVADDRLESEIAQSWQRVRAETDAAIPVFCYPNGDAASFGQREERAVARHGFQCALSAVAGHASPADFAENAARRFRIPRYGCPRDPVLLRWLASGWPAVWHAETP